MAFLQMPVLSNEKNQKAAGRLWVAGKFVSLAHFSPESVRVKCKELNFPNENVEDSGLRRTAATFNT